MWVCIYIYIYMSFLRDPPSKKIQVVFRGGFLLTDEPLSKPQSTFGGNLRLRAAKGEVGSYDLMAPDFAQGTPGSRRTSVPSSVFTSFYWSVLMLSSIWGLLQTHTRELTNFDQT